MTLSIIHQDLNKTSLYGLRKPFDFKNYTGIKYPNDILTFPSIKKWFIFFFNKHEMSTSTKKFIVRVSRADGNDER